MKRSWFDTGWYIILLLVVALSVGGCTIHDAIGIRPALERCGVRGEQPSPVGMLVPHLACR